jgi:hypothetical protein
MDQHTRLTASDSDVQMTASTEMTNQESLEVSAKEISLSERQATFSEKTNTQSGRQHANERSAETVAFQQLVNPFFGHDWASLLMYETNQDDGCR